VRSAADSREDGGSAVGARGGVALLGQCLRPSIGEPSRGGCAPVAREPGGDWGHRAMIRSGLDELCHRQALRLDSRLPLRSLQHGGDQWREGLPVSRIKVAVLRFLLMSR
jgi:hypothetical protein